MLDRQIKPSVLSRPINRVFCVFYIVDSRRAEFATLMLEWIDANNNKVCFSDKATFHTSGNVKRHNVRIWGWENPHIVLQHVRHSPKVNVWWGLMHNKITGPFFFNEPPTTATLYLDMLEVYVTPQLQNFNRGYCFNMMVHRHIED